MITVAALTSGKFEPSSRFRIRQHIASLRTFGVLVREYLPALGKYALIPGRPMRDRPQYLNPFGYLWEGLKLAARLPGIVGSHRCQITWLERGIMDWGPTLEPLLKPPIVVDVDDAVFLLPPLGKYGAIIAAKLATLVIAGNQYLANWYSRYARDIRIIPTAVDTHRFRPRTKNELKEPGNFIIGWTGSASNLVYLHAIESPLRHFLENYEDTEICVVANKPPSFKTIPGHRVRFIAWSPEIESEAVRGMDVGLMPLPDNPWTRGKCSFKMLQYMATGIPAIASPVGMNADILAMDSLGLPASTDDDWYEALTYFYVNRDKCIEYGLKGREVAERNYSQKIISSRLASIFRELA
jgi:glycosyltransferase involved in cell wall biosynthesis